MFVRMAYWTCKLEFWGADADLFHSEAVPTMQKHKGFVEARLLGEPGNGQRIAFTAWDSPEAYSRFVASPDLEKITVMFAHMYVDGVRPGPVREYEIRAQGTANCLGITGMLLDLPTAARYNAWANTRIYNSARQLTDADRKEDRRGFFKSIHNTLNHTLLADLIYRERLEKMTTTFTSLDQILCEDFAGLEARQRANDIWYVGFCECMDPAELDGDLSFQAVGMDSPEFFSLSLRTCLTNLLQHQIHHRGQVHHMLSHAGIYPPPLDVVKFGRGDVDEWSYVG